MWSIHSGHGKEYSEQMDSVLNLRVEQNKACCFKEFVTEEGT